VDNSTHWQKDRLLQCHDFVDQLGLQPDDWQKKKEILDPSVEHLTSRTQRSPAHECDHDQLGSGRH
jgi:hypothetical protein